MHRPHPGDDLPGVIIGLDGLAEGRIGPTTASEPFSGIALLLELDGAKRDQSKECIVVIAIDPNLIGEGGSHAAATTTSVAAIAAERHDLMTFLRWRSPCRGFSVDLWACWLRALHWSPDLPN
jgi:hypothetical protein